MSSPSHRSTVALRELVTNVRKRDATHKKSDPMEGAHGRIIRSNPSVEVGTQALLKRRNVVWTGHLGAPIDDAGCDEIELNPIDYARLLAELRQHAKLR